jgi:hypothetical protein
MSYTVSVQAAARGICVGNQPIPFVLVPQVAPKMFLASAAVNGVAKSAHPLLICLTRAGILCFASHPIPPMLAD